MWINGWFCRRPLCWSSMKRFPGRKGDVASVLARVCGCVLEERSILHLAAKLTSTLIPIVFISYRTRYYIKTTPEYFLCELYGSVWNMNGSLALVSPMGPFCYTEICRWTLQPDFATLTSQFKGAFWCIFLRRNSENNFPFSSNAILQQEQLRKDAIQNGSLLHSRAEGWAFPWRPANAIYDFMSRKRWEELFWSIYSIRYPAVSPCTAILLVLT